MKFPSNNILLLFLTSLVDQTSSFCPAKFAVQKNIHPESDALFASFSERDDPEFELPEFSSKEEYLNYLDSELGQLPVGFECGVATGTFISAEAPALGPLPIRATVIALAEDKTKTNTNSRPARLATHNWAAVFTKNKFPGAPISVGRSRLANGGPLQAIVINNKVSNVCSGSPAGGVADAETVCAAVAKALDLEEFGAQAVLPSSTGVIGWRIPVEELASEIVPKAIVNLKEQHENKNTLLSAATAIMTTDRYPKVRSYVFSNGSRLVGIAKGAGMIEPNMATMLSYIMTDLTVDRTMLQDMLSEVVEESYNSISVDGDESTSDTVVLISSNQFSDNSVSAEEFKVGLISVCKGLAADIVRNGEGTSHVIRVKVSSFPGSNHDARRLGKQVVNSPLFKCAVSGNDPNIGRLAAAIGSFLGKLDGYIDGSASGMTIKLGGRIIFTGGKFVLGGDEVEQELSDHMKDAAFGEHDDYPKHQRFVEIEINFGEGSGGNGSAIVLGSDLTKEYVNVNADYRS